MKKIAIVTIVDYNYGNRLQNYAVQKILQQHGLAPETIRLTNRWPDEFKHSVRDALKKDRFASFRKFDKQIIWSRYTFFDDYSDAYDLFSIGSDQVWNAEWFDHISYRRTNFLLSFAKPEQRICVSPSFGVSSIPDNWRKLFKTQLSKFPRLSVREKDGADIISELTGKEAQVLIDPTLVLDREEWMKVASPPKKIDIDSPYLLTYFLGGRDERENEKIAAIAAEKKLRVIHLMSPEMVKSDIGPSEFLYLFANAQLIMTDSFHACIFSFLFQKPFEVYPRLGSGGSMMSRINTLLKKLDLQRKFADSGLENDLFECQYESGIQKLRTEKEKFHQFLREALNESNEN